MLVLLLLVAPAMQAPVEWRRHAPPFALALPADHGAHPEFRTEWWYTTGEVASAAGERFAFQLTIFRQGLEPGLAPAGDPWWSARQVYAGHVALTRVAAQETLFAERMRRANGALAGAKEGDLDAWIEDWRLVRDPATGAVHASAVARERQLALDLVLAPGKAPVLHGADGLSHKGREPGNASAYVSWTRLAARGTVRLGARELAVEGDAWFDHEWGSSQLGAGVVGWDWFALRLDDGRELMLYRLRRADGSADPSSSATLVRADGTTRTLAADELELAVEARWKSPRTGAEYPARWRLAVPSERLTVTLAPRVADAELDARRSTGTIYWEGPVAVEGSVLGRGHAELTGYARSLAGRF